MREHKYRAWDCIKKSMGEVSVISFENHAVCFVGVKDPIALEDVELMQYTGLKDKNGVEIFEGDVVGLDGENGTIVFHNGSFILEYPGGIAEGNFYIPAYNGIRDLEVLGNIYEHPELLNKK